MLMRTFVSKLFCLAALTLVAGSVTAQETNKAADTKSAAAPRRWNDAVSGQKPEWYASAEAKALADSVVQYQSTEGGWPRNVDLATPPASPEALAAEQASDRANTFDNNATTQPLEFIARVASATGDAKYKDSFARGLDYLCAAQMTNGGFPQRYPTRIRKNREFFGYITYGDNVMINVLTILRAAAAGKAPYDFTTKEQRAQAAAALDRGVDCILRTQIKQDGKLTGWCAQHNPVTLEPAQGRDFEPPSISGLESASVVSFLMEIETPSPQIIAAVQGAAAWYEAVAIRGMRWEQFTNAEGKTDKRITPDPAGEPLWARFYELGTLRPLFTTHKNFIAYNFSEIPHDWRLNNYFMYGNWGTPVLKEYPAWCVRHKVAPVQADAPAKKP
jgi:PelA/Pel-15E family pectate lyase